MGESKEGEGGGGGFILSIIFHIYKLTQPLIKKHRKVIGSIPPPPSSSLFYVFAHCTILPLLYSSFLVNTKYKDDSAKNVFLLMLSP